MSLKDILEKDLIQISVAKAKSHELVQNSFYSLKNLLKGIVCSFMEGISSITVYATHRTSGQSDKYCL